MKNVRKGIVYILAVLLSIAALGYIAIFGIGEEHKGTTEHIRLGLDLAGGVSVTYEAVKKDPTATEMADTMNCHRRKLPESGARKLWRLPNLQRRAL